MRFVLIVAVASCFATPCIATSLTQQAEELEMNVKGACVPGMKERTQILDWRKCGSGTAVGTDAWFRCAGEIDRLNRAIFFWNYFVAQCRKKK